MPQLIRYNRTIGINTITKNGEAAVVVGNRGAEGAISYPYDATLTSTNSSFIIANNLPVYVAGYNGHTATITGIDSVDVIQSTGFGDNVVINS